MVTEIAQIDVKPGMESEFEAGVAKAAPLFRRAKGCSGMVLQRSAEKPQRYRLFVNWGTIENHTVDFRGSADFAEWRKLVGHCFASPPEVEHVQEVVKGFYPLHLPLVGGEPAPDLIRGRPREKRGREGVTALPNIQR